MAQIPAAEGRIFVGLDAEFFFMKDAAVVSAHTILPNKHNPIIVQEDRTGASPGSGGVGVAFHYDGVQAEFNAVESTQHQDVMRRVRRAMQFAFELTERHSLALSLRGSVPVDLEALATYPLDAVEFGCDIDFISWLEGMPNPINAVAEDHAFRYAGTHIHLGVPEDLSFADELLANQQKRQHVINVMDFLVGNTSVMLDQDPASTKRRELYGKAGTYRPTEYGLEYRVLSSFGLRSPHFLPLLWALSRESVRIVAANGHLKLYEAVSPRNVIRAINSNNSALALENWKGIRQHVQDFFVESELRPAALTALEFAAQAGITNIVSENIPENWQLNSEEVSLPTWSEDYPRLFDAAGFGDEFAKYQK